MNQGRDNRNRGSSGNRGGFNRGGNRGGFGGRNNFSNQNREMHKTTCDECKQACEVPFKPTEGKSVFCKECYSKKKKY